MKPSQHGGPKSGKRDSGYFTDDKSDARGTAASQIRWLRRQPACKV